MLRIAVRRILPLACVLWGAAALDAQVLPVKSVPVAAGDQFLLLPARSLGMGGVTLALDDALADGWDNPAKGVLVEEPVLLASPTFYGMSGDNGGARSFPVAALLRGRRWFGGLAFALQQIQNERSSPTFFAFDIWAPPGAERLSDRSARNVYARAFVGTRIGQGPWSAGLGLSAAGLHAVDGVDLLYANAQRIAQHGSTADVRVGVYREGTEDRLSFVVVHDRISMTHDVSYVQIGWTPMGTPLPFFRTEINHDRTRTWGAQLGWDHALTAPGWRVGTVATLNRKSHPSIPDYEIQNIPRDPGVTWATELGVGVARTRGATEIGLDLLFQPKWSHTWQEADQPVETIGGVVLLAGESTVDNDFFFTDVVLRTGMSQDMGSVSVQGGLELRSYAYGLDQHDRVRGTLRHADEAWMEWSPSAGATFRLGDVEVRYAGRLTTGTGRPGIELTPQALADQAALSDFIIAPAGPLTLQEVTVLTHQLSVKVPVR